MLIRSLIRSSAIPLVIGLLSAQQQTPCGPYRVSLAPETELTAAAFGATEILDLCLVPDPNVAGGYFGFVLLPSGAQAFRWQPGSAPVATTQPGVSTPGAVKSISVGAEADAAGNLTVVTVRPASFFGFQQTYISKVTPDAVATWSNETSSGAFTAATPRFALGSLGGDSVVFQVSRSQHVTIEDIEIDPASPSYGTRSNSRGELLGFILASDVVAIRGANGATRSLLIAKDGSGFPLASQPTIWFRDVPEGASMPITGATNSEVLTVAQTNLEVSWIAQIDSATFLVQFDGQAPQRLQLVSTSSTAAPIGTTTSIDVRMPSDRPGDAEFCFAVISFAPTAPTPAPVAGGILGNFCVSQTAQFVLGNMTMNTGFVSIPISVPNDPSWVGVVLSAQGIGFESGSPNGYFGNAASFEITN